MDHTRYMAETEDLLHLTKAEQVSFKGKHCTKEDLSTSAVYNPGTYSSMLLENAQYLMAL